jgi:hypothetical protein
VVLGREVVCARYTFIRFEALAMIKVDRVLLCDGPHQL